MKPAAGLPAKNINTTTIRNGNLHFLPIIFLFAGYLFCLFNGCETTGVTFQEGRIVPGVSIDNIKFGDSNGSVEKLIGKPDETLNIFTKDRPWFGYGYTGNTHAE
jgi:hypothetical protein